MKRTLFAALAAVVLLASAGRCSEDIDDAVSQFAKSFAKSQKGVTAKGPDGKPTVAILPLFTVDGKTSEFGKYFAERLLTQLYEKKGFNIVDRSLLDKVLKEQKLGETGLIDANSAKQLGKLLGADLIGTGTYTNLGKKLDINTRLIATETGVVASADEDKIDINDEVQKLLGPAPAPAPSPSASSGQAPSNGPALSAVEGPAPLEVQKGKLLFEENCAKPAVGERKGHGPAGPWRVGRNNGECYVDATHRKTKGYAWWARKRFGDFILEARMLKQGQGPVGYGVMFRAKGSKHPYSFWILEGGEYLLAKMPGKNWIALDHGSDPAIHSGGTADNDIRIIAVGPVIQIYVNDKRIILLADNSMKFGQAALFAEKGSAMRFSEFRVYAAKP
jgi:TolB-like protein